MQEGVIDAVDATSLPSRDGLQLAPESLGLTPPGVPLGEDDLVEQSHVAAFRLKSAKKRDKFVLQMTRSGIHAPAFRTPVVGVSLRPAL